MRSQSVADRLGAGRFDDLPREGKLMIAGFLLGEGIECPIFPIGNWILSIKYGNIWYWYDGTLVEVQTKRSFPKASNFAKVLLTIERRDSEGNLEPQYEESEQEESDLNEGFPGVFQ